MAVQFVAQSLMRTSLLDTARVGIGHVGRIVLNGGYDPICAAADDPINSDGVPDGFEQLVLESQDVSIKSKYYNNGLHICSEPLEKKIDDV